MYCKFSSKRTFKDISVPDCIVTKIVIDSIWIANLAKANYSSILFKSNPNKGE